MKSSLLITLCFLLLFCTAAFGQELAKEAFNDGRKAFAEEKYDEALRHFLKARETDAKNPEVHIWLGNAYLALGRADDAAESWEKALNIAPDNETLKARLERLRGVVADIDKDIATIEMLLEQRLYKSALFRARETLKKPASVQKRAHIEMLIAEALWGNGENQRALEQVLGWEIRYPEAPDEGKARARLIHGRALAGLGKNDEARKHFKYIIEKHAKSPSALEARFELARLLEKEKHIKAAVEAYLDFVARDEAKKAGDRWFVREARERLLALLLRLGCSEPVSPGAVALVPFHEKALELIIESARAGDESSLRVYIRGLNVIVSRYITSGAPTAAANAVGKVLTVLPETSGHFPVVLLLLGRAHFAEGAKMFQENLERTGVSAEEEKPNEKFAAAVRVFLRAAKFPDAQDAAIAGVKSVAGFYAQRGIPNPAIVVYTQLLDGKPPRADDVKATLAQMYFRKEKSDAAKLAKAFLPVPKKLGDSAKKALALIREVAAAGRKSEAARNSLCLAQEIAHFYAQLYYYEVAREALYLLLDKPPAPGGKPEGALADFVIYAGADVSKIEADRDFSRRDSMFGGIKDNRQPTELHRAVLKAYQDVIGSYPESPLVVSARRQMTRIAEMYLNKSAFDAAREAYRQIASANAKWSGAERMTYMAARCLLLKANEALERWMSAAKEGAKPEKLSAEYDAAIKGYIEMIKAVPDGFYVSNVYRDIREIALTYARADAWNIASAVYGRFLDEKLSYRYPEQVRFERAMCETGKVMPEHALKMLELIAKEPVPVGGLAGLEPASRPEHIKTSPDWGSLDEKQKILFDVSGGKAGRKKSFDELLQQKDILKAELKTAIDELQMQRERLEKAMERVSPEERMEVQTEELGRYQSDVEFRATFVKVRQKEAELARKISQLESNIQSETQGRMALQRRRPVNVEDYYENVALIKDRIVRISIITEEEIKRRVEALNAAYKMFQAIIREYEGKPAAYKARAEIMIAIGHLRSIHAHNHAAAMLAQFIKDNPKDGGLARLSLQLRMDYLAWARTAPDPKMEEMDRLAETGRRFKAAREELDGFIKDPVFRDEREALETARMALAKSFLDEARLVGALSPTQSRGRYVRAAKELLQLAREGTKTVSAGTVFSPVWQIARELEGRRFWEGAIDVYRMLIRQYPVRARVNQAGLRIANAYHNGVKDYLRAVEAYQEFLSSDSGANAAGIQKRILDIGRYLRRESRWVEALHVYSVFVDSFPRHTQAGEALRAIGEIHQANYAWEKAIAAYERVIEEYGKGDWTRRARMSIATCYIQLSRWRKAVRSYEDYIRVYPRDGQASIARTRIPILKEIESFQELIDEGKSPKRDDAQSEIARLVKEKIGDKVKAIIEYEKVAKNYPDSHLADDALFAAGLLYLQEGKLEEGRETLRRVAAEYPTSPMADDALYKLGQSYEKQAQDIEGITLQDARQFARKNVQGEQYKLAARNAAKMDESLTREIKKLRAGGKKREAEMAEANRSAMMNDARAAQAGQAAQQSRRMEETMTAFELANRQDRVNAALRDAIKAYAKASAVALGDFADDALLRMAEIYETKLKDPKKAMEVYDKIVRTFPGTAVAENAVWRRAQYFVREGQFKKAEDEYKTFVSNYPNSTRVEEATFRLAEVYEQQNKWVEAMDTYRNYINRFSKGPRVQQARERIIWIKTYRLYE